MKLSVKQKKFADEYLISGNATEAYQKANYKVQNNNSTRANASRLLTNDNVKKYLAKRQKEIESHKIMDIKEAFQLLTSIARGEEQETVIVSTRDDVWHEKKEADLKTRISAIKEILKRYPDKNDEAQIRKHKAEADIAEWKASELAGTNKANDKTVLVDDIGGNDNGNNGN